MNSNQSKSYNLQGMQESDDDDEVEDDEPSDIDDDMLQNDMQSITPNL